MSNYKIDDLCCGQLLSPKWKSSLRKPIVIKPESISPKILTKWSICAIIQGGHTKKSLNRNVVAENNVICKYSASAVVQLSETEVSWNKMRLQGIHKTIQGNARKFIVWNVFSNREFREIKHNSELSICTTKVNYHFSRHQRGIWRVLEVQLQRSTRFAWHSKIWSLMNYQISFLLLKELLLQWKKWEQNNNVFKLSKEFLNRNFQRILSKLYHKRG